MSPVRYTMYDNQHVTPAERHTDIPPLTIYLISAFFTV